VARRRWHWALGWGLTGAALVQVADAARKDSHRQHAINDRWHFAGRQVGVFLRYAFAEQRPLLAVDAAGCLPFFYQLPALDMLGLTDSHIARHAPPGFGTDFLGHELGDGKYPTFYQLYQAVTFDTFDGIRARLGDTRNDGPLAERAVHPARADCAAPIGLWSNVVLLLSAWCTSKNTSEASGFPRIRNRSMSTRFTTL
jgi:hypothetical protein